MTPKKSPGESAPGPYTLELDASLLEEAVAAVEQHSKRKLRPPSELPTSGFRPPQTRRPPAEEPARRPPVEEEVEIEIPVSLGDAPEVEEDSTEEPGLDLSKMAVEWDRLVAEIEQLRVERDAARRQAETEARERVRLSGRIKRLSEQLDQAQDQLNRAEEARRHAEQESAKAREESRSALEGVSRMRERIRRGEEEQKNFGHAPVILGLLPVIENLERAASHADSNPERVGEGLRMILDQFHNALARVGVSRVNASTGVPFQPALHEAVIHVPLAGVVPGTVAAELQSGYMLHGRLLRPARVSVAAPSESAPEVRQDGGRGSDELLELSDELSVLPGDANNGLTPGEEN